MAISDVINAISAPAGMGEGDIAQFGDGFIVGTSSTLRLFYTAIRKVYQGAGIPLSSPRFVRMRKAVETNVSGGQGDVGRTTGGAPGEIYSALRLLAGEITAKAPSVDLTRIYATFSAGVPKGNVVEFSGPGGGAVAHFYRTILLMAQALAVVP